MIRVKNSPMGFKPLENMRSIIVASAISMFFAFSFNVFAQGDFNEKLSGPYLGQNLPADTPVIFAPGIVSTEMYNHSSISISPDGHEIFWAMSPLDTPHRIYYTNDQSGTWSEPKIIHFTQIEDGPMISPDGSKMYFISNRAIGEGNGRRERIWCVDRVDGIWGEPFPLAMEINGAHLHWQVSIDNTGNLYFGSERMGSKGKDDIFLAVKSNGIYQPPTSLGENINTAAHESTPFISPYGDFLIFNRDGLQISFKDQNDHWSKAIPMGELYDGACPYVSPDGEYMFFLKMGMGYNDIYWVSTKIIEALKIKSR